MSGEAKPKLLTSIADVQQLDEQSWELFRGTALCARPGSISKVISTAYPKWGVGLTDENARWLKERAEFYHEKDLQDNGRHIVPESTGVLFRDSVEIIMVNAIASGVIEAVSALDDGMRTFHVCDLGARTEKTLTAIAATAEQAGMNSAQLDRISFTFADAIGDPVHKDQFRSIMQAKGLKCSGEGLSANSDEKLLAGLREKSVDVMISFLHLHNKPFVEDMLNAIRRVLTDEGVLLIADWHSALWQDPQNIYVLLETLGADQALRNKFRAHFDLSVNPRLATAGLNEAEIAAVTDHMIYWASIGRQLQGDKRIYYLAAHQTSRQRVESLENTGFTTDPEKIKRAFPRSRLPQLQIQPLRTSDFARVMIAIKRG